MGVDQPGGDHVSARVDDLTHGLSSPGGFPTCGNELQDGSGRPVDDDPPRRSSPIDAGAEVDGEWVTEPHGRSGGCGSRGCGRGRSGCGRGRSGCGCGRSGCGCARCRLRVEGHQVAFPFGSGRDRVCRPDVRRQRWGHRLQLRFFGVCCSAVRDTRLCPKTLPS